MEETPESWLPGERVWSPLSARLMTQSLITRPRIVFARRSPSSPEEQKQSQPTPDQAQPMSCLLRARQLRLPIEGQAQAFA